MSPESNESNESGTTSAAVVTIPVTINVAKESKEVVDAVTDLIADIKAGKDVGQIAAENLPGLIAAIDGYDKLDDEMKSGARNETVAYAGLKVADSLGA